MHLSQLSHHISQETWPISPHLKILSILIILNINDSFHMKDGTQENGFKPDPAHVTKAGQKTGVKAIEPLIVQLSGE